MDPPRFTPPPSPRETLRQKLQSGEPVTHLTDEEREEWDRVVAESQAKMAAMQNSGMEPWARALAGAMEKEDGNGREGSAPVTAVSASLFLPADVVARLDAEKGWQPSEDQERAITVLTAALTSPGIYVLCGAAGTGKTSLVRSLLRRLTPERWQLILMAPTWRAARRLEQITAMAASSIHHVLYGRPFEECWCPERHWSFSLMIPVRIPHILDGSQLLPLVLPVRAPLPSAPPPSPFPSASPPSTPHDSAESVPAVRLRNRCARCHRTLTDAASVQVGMGPVCREVCGLTAALHGSAHAEANVLLREAAASVDEGVIGRVRERLTEMGLADLARFVIGGERVTIQFRKKRGSVAEEQQETVGEVVDLPSQAAVAHPSSQAAVVAPPDPEVHDLDDPPLPPLVAEPRYVCNVCHAVFADTTRFPEQLSFATPTDRDDPGAEMPRLVICDEASMVGPTVARDIQEVLGDDRTRILYVGDANQLPYVENTSSPRGWPEDGPPVKAVQFSVLDAPTAALNTIHRQAAGNPVLALAHTLKTTPEVSTVRYPFPWRLPGVSIHRKVTLAEPAQWAAGMRRGKADAALIAYSNHTRALLNRIVRYFTGALAWAAAQPCTNLIPGDRLLARDNPRSPKEPKRNDGLVGPAGAEASRVFRCGGVPRVYNGDLWTLCTLTVADDEFSEDGRAKTGHRDHRHDQILSVGVRVYLADIARVGRESERENVILVLPMDGNGRPVLESDMICSGVAASEARQQCRNITKAWRLEYAAAIRGKQAEFERAQKRARDLATARVHLEHEGHLARSGKPASAERTKNLMWARQELCSRAENAEAREALGALVDRAAQGEPLPPDSPLLQSARDAAVLACNTVQDYCELVYGALDPARACTFDFGECLTCHAMQGDQAANVAVVFDGAFWAMWWGRHEEGLRWTYTAVTRTSDQLTLFSIETGG